MTTSTKPSFAVKHKTRWNETADGWDRLLEKDYTDTLDRDPMPEGFVESLSLKYGLYCLYAGDHEHADAFCRRAIVLADQIIADDKCRANPIREQGYPRNVGEVFRGKTYAKWLLGEPLDRKLMYRVAESMREWCLTKAIDQKQFHDSITMNMYMEGVRAAMIASDLDYASELLKTKHKFRWHHAIERNLWTQVIAAYPDVPQVLREDVETFFDRVRDPDFKEEEWSDTAHRFIPTFINREILALDTGIIRQMYIINASPLDPVDPKAVIEAVAY